MTDQTQQPARRRPRAKKQLSPLAEAAAAEKRIKAIDAKIAKLDAKLAERGKLVSERDKVLAGLSGPALAKLEG